MTACVQSVVIFGSEVWWKGYQTRGTIGQAMSCSFWSTKRRERLWRPWQWNRGSGQRQPSWRTGSNGSAYGCSAYGRVTRLGRSSVSQQLSGRDLRMSSHTLAGRSARDPRRDWMAELADMW